MRTFNKYGEFYSIINQNGFTKEEVVLAFTEGETDSLKALTDFQFQELMRRLKPYKHIPPGDLQRKKMIGLVRSMRYASTAEAAVTWLDGWLLKQKYKRRLMLHTPEQLGIMVTVLENMYADYLKKLN